MSDQFFEQGTRLLTPHAFDFVLEGELKQAVRSQNYLTLVVLEAQREWDGMAVTADPSTVGEVAELVGHEIRHTDLIGVAQNGCVSLALLDADFENSQRVLDRVVQRIDDYDFPTPLRISMGAACYPTHAVDADSLKKQAWSRPVVSWRGGAHAADTHH